MRRKAARGEPGRPPALRESEAVGRLGDGGARRDEVGREGEPSLWLI